MVHWVYILECEDDYIYVGETTRLYGRFHEHNTGKGGKNTSLHKPETLVGLYRVNSNACFIDYRNMIKSGEFNPFMLNDWDNDGDNLLVENHITERLMHERKTEDWSKIRGGKYTKETFGHYPIDKLSIDKIIDRPLCKCGYPSEVKLNKAKTIYFVCCLKNTSWPPKFSTNIPHLFVPTPCDFRQWYVDDKEVKQKYEIIKVKSRENWVLNIPLSQYKINPEPCILCEKTGYVAIYNNGTRRLCQTCMLINYDSLKEKYDLISKCLIDKDDDDNWN